MLDDHLALSVMLKAEFACDAGYETCTYHKSNEFDQIILGVRAWSINSISHCHVSLAGNVVERYFKSAIYVAIHSPYTEYILGQVILPR